MQFFESALFIFLGYAIARVLTSVYRLTPIANRSRGEDR